MGWCSMVTMKDEGQWLANLTVIVGGGTHGRTGIVIIIIVIFIAVLLEHYQSIQVFSLWQIWQLLSEGGHVGTGSGGLVRIIGPATCSTKSYLLLNTKCCSTKEILVTCSTKEILALPRATCYLLYQELLATFYTKSYLQRRSTYYCFYLLYQECFTAQPRATCKVLSIILELVKKKSGLLGPLAST